MALISSLILILRLHMQLYLKDSGELLYGHVAMEASEMNYTLT